MRDGDIDYSKYSFRELNEALSGIDRTTYPKNFANLQAARELLLRLNPALLSTVASDELERSDDCDSRPRYDEHGRYIPNHIPIRDRIEYLCVSVVLLSYGGYGIWVNDIYLPRKRFRGIHLHDVPAWVMFGAILCACVMMISVVADHYDTRDNEHQYRAVADACKYLGLGLFAVALFLALLR